MNILFLPQNIASMPAITADSLCRKENMHAVCLTIGTHKYQQVNKNVVVIATTKRRFIKWLWYKINLKRTLKKWINWADVVHYTWTPVYSDARDVKYAHEKEKKIFVEWVGSDIRDPDYLKRINSYYAYAYEHGYEYATFESKAQSLKNQTLFSKYGAIPLLSPEMSLFADKSLFKNIHLLYQRINLKDIQPKYPAVNNNRPVIIHSPSAKIAKGSNIIIPLMESLKQEYDFEFILLHNLSREEVLKKMEKADIFIDQIILGSYGMAALEAMSFGKPVVCYIMPEVFEAGLSEECPIINASPDNLKEQLIKLISNPQLRHAIGIKSRKFAEKFHEVEKVSSLLVSIYKTEPDKRQNA